MGIVIRQSVRTVGVTYIGAFIGFVNTLWLYPLVLSEEQVGLTRTLINVCMLFSSFAALGAGFIPQRFFPYFKDYSKEHNGFLFFLLMLGFVGYVIFVIVFLCFKLPIIAIYAPHAPLLVEYMYYVIPLTGFLVCSAILEMYLIVQQMPVVPNFTREVLVRASTTIGLLALAARWCGFHMFVIIIVAGYASAVLVLIVYTKMRGILFWTPNFTTFKSKYLKSIFVFAGFVILSNASNSVIGTIDGLMLSAYSGLKSTGIYSIAFFIAVIIEIPRRSLSQVLIPLVSEANKSNAVPKLEELYKKSSINQLIVGGLLFLGIWCNIDNIFRLIPHGAIYSQGKWVVFYVGLAKVVDMGMGINGEIIGTSKYYRMDLLFFALLSILGIVMNMIFIPMWGILGAALAALFSFLLFNIMRYIYIYVLFHIQPFTFNTVKALAIAGVVLLVNTILPPLPTVIVDIIYRSIFIVIIFIGLSIIARLSEDINTTLMKLWKAVRARFK